MEHGGSPGEFLVRMRRYMPPVQRGLIAWVSSHPGLRGEAEIRGLGERYNECVMALAELRTQHLVLVSRYITSQVTCEENGHNVSQIFDKIPGKCRQGSSEAPDPSRDRRHAPVNIP